MRNDVLMMQIYCIVLIATYYFLTEKISLRMQCLILVKLSKRSLKHFVSYSSRQLLPHYPISKPENCKCQLRLFLVGIFKLRPSLGKSAWYFTLYVVTVFEHTLERLQAAHFLCQWNNLDWKSKNTVKSVLKY